MFEDCATLYAAGTAVVRKARNAERNFADLLYFKNKKAKEDILALI
jgi:hypothetical protein